MPLPANPVPEDLYPLATEGGVAIPLAVARPIGSYRLTLEAGVNKSITLGADYNIISIYSDKDGLLKLSTSTISGDLITDSFRFLAEVQYDLVVDKTITLLCTEAAVITINVLRPWAQLGNHGRYSAS